MKSIVSLLLLSVFLSQCRKPSPEEFLLNTEVAEVFSKPADFKAFVYRNDEDTMSFDTFYTGGFEKWMEHNLVEPGHAGYNSENIKWFMNGTGDIDSISMHIDARRQIDWQDWGFYMFGRPRPVSITYGKPGGGWTEFQVGIKDTMINGTSYKNVLILHFLQEQNVQAPGPVITNYYHTYFWNREQGLFRYEYYDQPARLYRYYTLVNSIK